MPRWASRCRAADATRRAIAVIGRPFRGPLCRGSLAADRCGRGARRPARRPRGRGAWDRGIDRRELWQSGGRWRERRARTRRRAATSQARRAGAQGSWVRAPRYPLVQEAGRSRGRARCAAWSQGRRLREKLISTAWRCASPTPRAPMRLWWRSRSPIPAARIRASAD